MLNFMLQTPARGRSLLQAALVCAALLTPLHATADTGPLQALESKYKITQTTVDRTQIADPGIVMEIVAHGINALPWGGIVTFDNPIVDGKVKQRSAGIGMLTMSLHGTSNVHILQPGDKVYITKMETKQESKDDVLRIVILTCDPLDVNGGASQRRYSAGLSFRFPKDTLAESSPDEIEHTIEGVLAPSTGDSNSDSNQQQAAAPPQQPAPAAAPAPLPPSPPPVQTATISLGETTEQVIAAMGLPKQVIDLGTKKIYQYPTMKITFIGDKVKDVE